MSTTSDPEVALRYSASKNCVLLRLETKSFAERGADIAYLSAYPTEHEVLYPPLTFLRPTGDIGADRLDNGAFVGVIEVAPSIGGSL